MYGYSESFGCGSEDLWRSSLQRFYRDCGLAEPIHFSAYGGKLLHAQRKVLVDFPRKLSGKIDKIGSKLGIVS
ncbi:Hypothetical protein ETEE_2597 [Edwardsiella anguillarum ET080813]|uniref:Uncharacterized protein n=1 Tax=Edwardsiella anguillarum ET080813 TaxID=667120 RepID=A0A076LU15_9GAMM|nr:Hypothetical protein ETEE_2597 [Edwardsiella anguillarum ET080813]